MNTHTFKDLMRFQKMEIINELVKRVSDGSVFTWTCEEQAPAVVALDEVSDIPVTLPSEISAALSDCLERFNRAPDNHQLCEFLSAYEVAA